MGIPVEWIAVLRSDVLQKRLVRSKLRGTTGGGVTIVHEALNGEFGKCTKPFRITCETWFDAREQASITMQCEPGELVVMNYCDWRAKQKSLVVDVPVTRRPVPPLTKKARTK